MCHIFIWNCVNYELFLNSAHSSYLKSYTDGLFVVKRVSNVRYQKWGLHGKDTTEKKGYFWVGAGIFYG